MKHILNCVKVTVEECKYKTANLLVLYLHILFITLKFLIKRTFFYPNAELDS